MTVNRDTARRYTTRARGAAIALLAAAGAVIALPLPMLRPAASAGATGATPPEVPLPEADPYEPPLDTVAATGTLWNVGLPPADPVVDAEVKPAAGSGTATAGATPAAGDSAKGTWRFVGSIIGPRGTHALLEYEGRQRLAKAGERVDGTRVVSIGEDHVMLDDGTGPKRIGLAPLASRWNPENVPRPQVAASTPAGRTGAQPRPGVPSVRGNVNPMGNPAANMVNQANMASQAYQGRLYSPEGMSDDERVKYEVYEKARQRAEEEGAVAPEEGAQR